MSQIGLGVMIHRLEHDPENMEKYYGREICSANIDDEALTLEFSDGGGLELFDGGQSCCEHRYMSTDDDVSSLIGHKLIRIEAKEFTENEDGGNFHEMCFVEVATDNGFITLVNHNENNGYYGGFSLTVKGFNNEKT